MGAKPRILVSACLLGVRCRYDGGGILLPDIGALLDRCEWIPVCPEQLGGLPTPRAPSERRGDRVVTRDGAEVTAFFHRGAEEVCRLATLYGARIALLKQRSPSCGCGKIYDGSFSGRVIPGEGITAQMLRETGVRVFSEEDLSDALKALAEITRIE